MANHQHLHPMNREWSHSTDCPICQHPVQDPMMTDCHHVFCKGCIALWTERTSTCPVCRSDLQPTAQRTRRNAAVQRSEDPPPPYSPRRSTRRPNMQNETPAPITSPRRQRPYATLGGFGRGAMMTLNDGEGRFPWERTVVGGYLDRRRKEREREAMPSASHRPRTRPSEPFLQRRRAWYEEEVTPPVPTHLPLSVLQHERPTSTSRSSRASSGASSYHTANSDSRGSPGTTTQYAHITSLSGSTALSPFSITTTSAAPRQRTSTRSLDQIHELDVRNSRAQPTKLPSRRYSPQPTPHSQPKPKPKHIQPSTIRVNAERITSRLRSNAADMHASNKPSDLQDQTWNRRVIDAVLKRWEKVLREKYDGETMYVKELLYRLRLYMEHELVSIGFGARGGQDEVRWLLGVAAEKAVEEGQ